MARVTMKDIANKAGISQQAVSLIMNHKASMVSQATRQKVWRLVRELNYTPNYAAQSLRSGKRYCIGVAGTGSLEEMDDLTISRIYSGIGEVVQEYHHNLMFIPLGQDNLLDMLIRTGQSGMVDGLLIMVYSSFIDDFQQKFGVELNDKKIPFVAIHSTGTELGCHNVGFNAERAGYLAGSHLAECGYTSVGEIGPVGKAYADQLGAGFARALDEAGITGLHRIATAHRYRADIGYRCGRDILASGMMQQAYFCHSDACAYGLIHAFEEAGLQVPEDAAVISVDDMIDLKQMYPRLTAVSRQFKQRGREAAEMLFGLMDGSIGQDDPRTVICEPELAIRETTKRYV